MPAPDLSASRVLLVGTSRYDDAAMPDLPSVARNVAMLSELLVDPAVCGVPAANLTAVLDPASPTQVTRPLKEAAEAAGGLLLFYYAGHGLIAGANRELHLSVTDTTKEAAELDGVSYDRVRELVLRSRARIKVVILDCCYSGKALGHLSGGGSAAIAADQAEIDGAFILTATPETKLAMAPEDGEYTAFTAELIDVLGGGLPGQPEHLSLDAIYHAVTRRLAAKGMPRAQAVARNNAGELWLARNAAWSVPAVLPPVPAARVIATARVPVPTSPPAVEPAIAPAARVVDVWRTHVAGAVRATPAVAAGLVVVPSSDGNLYALDAATGSVRWQAQVGAGLKLWSTPPLITGDAVFQGGGGFTALDLRDGRIRWVREGTGDFVDAAAIAYRDQIIVRGGTPRSFVRALDAATGEVRWETATGALLGRGLTRQGDMLVYAGGKRVVALSAATGTQLWERRLAAHTNHPAVIADGCVYVSALDRQVWALDVATGTVRWSCHTGGVPLSSPSEPARAGGLVLVTGADRNVHAIDAGTGTRVWTHKAGGSYLTELSNPNCSPRVSGDTVYVGSSDKHLYALVAATGEVRWRRPTDGVIAAPPALAAGMIYFGSLDRHVYALRDTG